MTTLRNSRTTTVDGNTATITKSHRFFHLWWMLHVNLSANYPDILLLLLISTGDDRPYSARLIPCHGSFGSPITKAKA